MFPVGAVVGGLLAARRAAAPTKARVIGSHYVAQARSGTQVALSAVTWGAGFSMGFVLALSKENAESARTIIATMALLTLAFSPLVLTAYGNHLRFDQHGIEAISFWRKRRSLPYRDLIGVRRKFTNDGFVLRGSNGVTLSISDSVGGWVTLANQILQHLPDGAKVSKAARRTLSTWAAADSS
jgi:hypothetical protein